MAFFGQSGAEDSVGGISATVTMDTSQIDPGVEGLKRKIAELGDRLQSLGATSATATTAVAAGMEKVDKNARAAGHQVQRFGYFLDDLQYVGEQGLRPILNNLMQIAPALGIAVLVGDQFVKKMGGIDAILENFGGGRVLTEAEHMEKLGRATHLTAEDQKRLNEYKKESQRIDAAMASRPKAEAAIEAGTAAVVAEADPDKVLAGIIKGRTKDKRFLEEDEKFGKLADLRERRRKLEEQIASKRLTDLEAMSAGPGPGAIERKLATVQENRREAIRRIDAEEIALRKEMFDRQRREAQKAMLNPEMLRAEIAKNPGFFPPNLGGELSRIYPPTPKSSEIDKQTDEMLKRHKEVEEDRAKERGKTMEELMVQEEMAEYDQSVLATIRSPRELAKRADLEERRGDLDWRMKLLMNPEKIGQSLGTAAYEKSFKATTGLSEEEKQTHAIQELLKEQEKNRAALEKLADVKVVAVAKP